MQPSPRNLQIFFRASQNKKKKHRRSQSQIVRGREKEKMWEKQREEFFCIARAQHSKRERQSIRKRENERIKRERKREKDRAEEREREKKGQKREKEVKERMGGSAHTFSLLLVSHIFPVHTGVSTRKESFFFILHLKFEPTTFGFLFSIRDGAKGGE